MKEICCGTFLISEPKNAYPLIWLTPCGSVSQVGLSDLRKCKMFELPWHFFPPSYSNVIPALFRYMILVGERSFFSPLCPALSSADLLQCLKCL